MAAVNGERRCASEYDGEVNRWRDWWNQSLRDVAHARHAADDADFEWSAFAAQQAAEKAVKALILASGGEPWGHSIALLIEALRDRGPDESIVEAGLRLDKHYLPTRYPNGLPAGHPGKYYTPGEAEKAIEDATTIIEFCRSRLPRP
jgi:HEPN domain-containing protein